MNAYELTKAGPLTGKAAIAVVATMIGVAFCGSTVVTPLYIVYEQTFHFSKIVLTFIYASYVVGNLSALLFFGRLSDQIGRRRVGLAALAICAASSLLFVFATGVTELFVARIVIGLGVGISAGTGTAWLAELLGKEKARAATIATASNFLGLALGPLVSGILADYAPWPLQLPFFVYLAVVALTALLIARTMETVAHPRALSSVSLKPRVGVPRNLRAAFVAPALAGAASMSLTGFYAALMPSILAESLNLKSHTIAGALVFELAVIVSAAIVLTRNVKSQTAMLWALALLIPSAPLVVAAQYWASLPVMLIGTAFCGVSSALGYRGSLQVVNEIAPADRRAEVVSAYFVACFSGNSIPIIGVGILSALVDPVIATAALAAMIALFALAAIPLALKYRS
ncbi:MAG: MFS transporter [Pseudolabrys sp.]|nr:MFS transporter [Pseudolabrys sp.]